jgi:exodeoxyribonuclease VII small subunit
MSDADTPDGTPDIPADIAALDFEEAYEALEEAIEKLETGELTLGESLALHERGVALSRRCDQLLTAAELRVRQVTEADSADSELDS